MGVVTAYLVRYRITEDVDVESSDRRVRRNADNLSTVIETTDTSVVISDLDPRIVYAVSVAARTDAGVGNYSHETIVPCRWNNSNYMYHTFATPTVTIIQSDWCVGKLGKDRQINSSQLHASLSY